MQRRAKALPTERPGFATLKRVSLQLGPSACLVKVQRPGSDARSSTQPTPDKKRLSDKLSLVGRMSESPTFEGLPCLF